MNLRRVASRQGLVRAALVSRVGLRLERRGARRALGLLAAGAVWAGCAADGGADEGPGLRFASLGVCQATGNDDRQIPGDIDRIVVELSEGALPSPRRVQAAVSEASAQGELVLPGVPTGAGYRLRVAGCQGTTARWGGEARDVAVAEFEKSFPDVFLTPLGQFACMGNARSSDGARRLSEPRVFGALAAGQDVAWAVGGAKRLTGTTLEGGSGIDRVDRLSGEVSSAGSLVAPRVMALARVLDGGTVRVVGGATKIQLAAAGKPAIWANPADAPAHGSEVFDPLTRESRAEYEAPLPALPALGAMTSGAIVAVGGSVSGAGGAADFSDALSIITVKTATAAQLSTKRFGAVVVELAPNLALVWGGNVDGDPARTGLLVDASKPAGEAVTELTVSGGGAVALFPAAAVVGANGDVFSVLVAGGGNIASGGAFPPKVDASRLELVTVDTAAGTASVATVDRGAFAAGAFARGAAQLAVLSGGELVFFGGYTAFSQSSFCTSTTDCIQTTALRFRVGTGAAPSLEQVGAPTELSVGPLGASAVALSDGAWLFTGGVESVAKALDPTAALMRWGPFDPDPCQEPLPTP